MPAEEETRRKNKEEDEKIEISRLAFSTLLKLSETFRIDLTLEKQRDIGCKLVALLCFVFQETALIPYVQAAILTLPHP